MAKKQIFNETKQEAEDFYKSLSSVYCPYFDEKVNFNTKGLDHIKFKDWNKTRPRKDQFMRLKLLYLTPEVIKKSHTLQGYSKTKEMERIKRNSRWEKVMKTIYYYEFIAILENIRVRVIIKQVSDGEKHFWSIIPYWKMGNNRKRIMHYGKPNED